MVVSNAFNQLSEVFAQLESSGSEIRRTAVEGDFSGADGDVSAELAVDVPLLPERGTSDAVSITAAQPTVEDGRVTLNLTVTVAASDVEGGGPLGRPRDTVGHGDRAGESVPAYKDPEALRTVYERHDTFPEMTEALSVDVTSETVRRHMIKYDIHDPSDTTPQPHPDAMTGAGGDGRTEPDGSAEPTPADADERHAERALADERAAGDEAATGSAAADSSSGEEPTEQSAITDGGNTTATGSTASEPSPYAGTPVTDLLPAGPDGQSTDEPTTNSIGLPETVTVTQLADAINQSQTIQEVAQSTNISQSTARQLLQELDLTNFVSHPLAAGQVTVSPEVIVRRIDTTT